MWFKNLQLYRLGQHLDLTPDALDERLQSAAFRGCGRLELTASGWVPPLGREGQQLVHAAGGYVMICSRKADKLIPAGVVKQLLDDKVAEVGAAESREVSSVNSCNVIDASGRSGARMSSMILSLGLNSDTSLRPSDLAPVCTISLSGTWMSTRTE